MADDTVGVFSDDVTDHYKQREITESNAQKVEEIRDFKFVITLIWAHCKKNLYIDIISNTIIIEKAKEVLPFHLIFKEDIWKDKQQMWQYHENPIFF
jgi:hypothetical protein